MGDDEIDMPYLERLKFCGCYHHNESDVVRFAVRALQKSVALRRLHLTDFLITKDTFFSPEMRAVLSDGRILELTFNRVCGYSFGVIYRRYTAEGIPEKLHCSIYIRDLEARKVELQLNGLCLKFCDFDRISD